MFAYSYGYIIQIWIQSLDFKMEPDIGTSLFVSRTSP